ncbi:hypothetical protein KBX71_32590 [Micromonospora sp. D93]|uniref:hypothetical protein n=1 Tax=Micromonospora sp. D93 TaxID=2824886 RepID=UPI001B38553F|nr:hypothetical protein [Micromonospora sp. D93]MBQ1022589.1 hypothetical protein [Micromonospora sp. D93]
MRIHKFTAGEAVAQTREVEPDVRLGDLLVLEDDEKVFAVDDEAELDVTVTVEAALAGRPGHLATSACRQIAVTVGYAGADKVVKVHPAIRLRQVRKRAIAAFGISQAAAADLVLRLPGETEDLDLNTPVTTIVPRRTCSAMVDLVHTVRPQG